MVQPTPVDSIKPLRPNIVVHGITSVCVGVGVSKLCEGVVPEVGPSPMECLACNGLEGDSGREFPRENTYKNPHIYN